MFGWLFRASCPCDTAAKRWIEERLAWLNTQFEDSAFTGRPIVLPTEEWFPDPYDGSKRSVRALLDRVCGYMDVAPERVALRFVSEAGKLWLVNDAGQYLPHAAGTYEEGRQRAIIRVDTSMLDNPMALVGTLAHELAHVRLMGEGRVDGDDYDNELLTDLAVVFLGLGIFVANAPSQWDSDYTTWPDTDLRKPEYMTPPMYGYALAHLAWHRGEQKPDWAQHLSMSARTNLREGLRYLWMTGDSSFRPWHARLV